MLFFFFTFEVLLILSTDLWEMLYVYYFPYFLNYLLNNSIYTVFHGEHVLSSSTVHKLYEGFLSVFFKRTSNSTASLCRCLFATPPRLPKRDAGAACNIIGR